MNALDKKLCRVLKLARSGPDEAAKKLEASYQFKLLLDQVRNHAISDPLASAFELVIDPKAIQAALLNFVEPLLHAGLTDTSAFLFMSSFNADAPLNYEKMLRLSPNIASVELWRKRNKIAKKDFQKTLLVHLSAVYESAAGDWLVKNGDLQQLSHLLGLFLKGQSRPQYLPPASETLAKRLGKDVKGSLLAELIKLADDPTKLKKLSEIALQKRAFKTIVDSFPKIIGSDPHPNLEKLFKEYVAAVMLSKGKDREFLSVGLARLTTGMLANENRHSQADGLIALAAAATQQLRILARESEEAKRTWVLENLAVETKPPAGQLQITEEGARHIAIAFQRVEEGFSTRDILTLTARNLGLSAIGQKGEKIPFNPFLHEDKEGDLLPGNSAVIEESGWRHGEMVVRKAKVKRGDQ
jgi:hypothetical protein